MMPRAMFFVLMVLALASGPGWAMSDMEFDRMMDRIESLQAEGNFAEADEAARTALADHGGDMSSEQRRALQFELERTKRTRKDYSLSADKLFGYLERSIKDVTREEFEQWIEEGRFDSLTIDGETFYVGPSRANLFFRYPDIRARAVKPWNDEWERFLQEEIDAITSLPRTPAQITLEPLDFRGTFTITVNPDVVPEGDTIRVWMPYPQQFEAQDNVRLISSSPEVAFMSHPTHPMRSLYFEAPSQGADPTEFQATFEFTTYRRYTGIDPSIVVPSSPATMPEFTYFTSEQPPHVIFTDRVETLVAEIIGDETNPAVKARLIYDWVCDNLVYSYAREYSTLRCISDYVLENEYGDCGQIALTYITLCRAAGIPARWQSGWIIYPMKNNLHDWTEIYLEPYGWVPVDPNYGMDIANYFAELGFGAEEIQKMRDFYFGGLDPFRFIANRDHGYPLYPVKDSFRSDTVDFQRGELEANGQNIYYGDFRYDLDIEHVWRGDDGAKDVEGARPAAPGAPR